MRVQSSGRLEMERTNCSERGMVKPTIREQQDSRYHIHFSIQSK
jgi:hypothetical protein